MIPARSTSWVPLLLHAVVRGAATLVLWTVWLGLALALAVQIYLATHHEIGVPAFVLRSLQGRLAASGLRAEFGRTQFDPTGRILIRDVRLTLPGMEEPVVRAAAVYGRLDWWQLIAGRFEPVEFRVIGASARVPAMMSPSGGADEIVRDLDGLFLPRGGDVAVPFITGWIGNLALSGQGTLHLSSRRPNPDGPLPLAQLIARQYSLWITQAARLSPWLTAMDRPALRAELAPSAPGRIVVGFSVIADGIKAPGLAAAEAAGVRLEGTWSQSGSEQGPQTVSLGVRRLVLPGRANVDGLTARVVLGGPNLAAGPWPVFPRTAEFSAASISVQAAAVQAGAARAVMGSVQAAGYPRVEGRVGAWLWERPVWIAGSADAARRSAAVTFDAPLGIGVLDTLQAVLGAELRPYLDWTAPLQLSGGLRWGPGGRFGGAGGVVTARGLSARGVKIDELRAEVRFDGSRLWAPRAYARLGEDFARGSYEQEMGTQRYRFLLDGRLRPLVITPWIAGDWWKEFFGGMGFPRQGPDANIDLSGCWTDARQAKIFLRVDVPGIVLEGLPLEELQGRMFLRPHYSDVLAVSARTAAGSVDGSLVRRYDLDAGDWRSLDVAVTSTVDPRPPLALLGGSEAAAMADFTFARPPHLTVTGHFDGPASGRGLHRQIQVGMRAEGATSYRGIPIDRLGFDATLADDAIDFSRIDAVIAGGTVSGKLALSGSGAGRRLAVSATARDVSLAQAAAMVQKISAPAPGGAAAKAGKFLQEKSAVKIDAGLSAQGLVSALDSFHGAGSAQLQGGEIGEIHMLGMLSQLLRFTSLRFTSAQTTFQLNGEQLIFPEVVISGVNAAIAGRGTYSLALHQLDFRARLDPFKNSQGGTRKFMDLVLTPLSNALEVRLTGTIEKPKWAFVNGPTNLLWSLRSPNSPVPPQTGFANPP